MSKRFFYLTVLIVAMCCLPEIAISDVLEGFSKTGDEKAKMGKIFKSIFDFFVLAIAGAGAIGFLWGLLEYNGVIGEEGKAPKRMKNSFWMLAGSGGAFAFITWLMSLTK